MFLLLGVSLLLGCSAQVTGIASKKDGVLEGDRRIFVTSAQYTGNLGGRSGADSICATHAQAGGLERTYRALIGLGYEGALGNPNQRITGSGAVYVVCGLNVTKVVSTIAYLWSGSLLAPVGCDEFGRSITADVWSGSTASGDVGVSCLDWITSNGPSEGLYGQTSRTDDFWFNRGVKTCNALCSLYCISD